MLNYCMQNMFNYINNTILNNSEIIYNCLKKLFFEYTIKFI